MTVNPLSATLPTMNDQSYILASNLAHALSDAIRVARSQDADHGPDFRSTYRAGLESCLDSLVKHGTIEVKWCDLSL